MYKKIAFVAGTFALLASPLLVSAQTTTGSSNTSLLATLEALVVQLEQELQQLIAARSSSSVQSTTTASASSPQPAASGMTTDVALACNAATGLKRGDTDATTGGKVSQLQAMLGISPTTGYYGAQTAIGYNNICVGGNSQPTSVAGMTEYVGADFSFWYPDSWTVQQITKAGGGVMNSLSLYGPTGSDVMDIDEIKPINGTLSNYIDNQDTESYYFDSSTGVWTYSQTSFGKTTTSPAPIALTTIGGLHVFTFSGLTSDDIIPLSATTFVTVSDTSDTYDVRPLARTVVATNPNVATPIPTAQQIAVIQAEANAYGAQTATAAQSSALQTYSNSQYGFSLQYPGDLFLNTSNYGSTHPFTGLPIAYIFVQNLTSNNATAQTEGYVSVNVSTNASDVADCSISGAIANVYDGAPAFTGSSNVSINGSTFLRSDRSDGGGVAGLERDYTTVHNGACYDLQVITFPSACVNSGCDDRQWSLQTETNLLNQLDPIAQSFRFTQ